MDIPSGGYRPKHAVLRDFSRIIFEHDPMGLRPDDDEYESEALSVLSRFNESALQACSNTDDRKLISEGIVRQALEFWFGEALEDVGSLAAGLLEAYLASYPTREQAADREVPSPA